MAEWTREGYGRIEVEPDGKNGFRLTGFKSLAEIGCVLQILDRAAKERAVSICLTCGKPAIGKCEGTAVQHRI